MATVAVVGGGITGLSCAYFLAELGIDPIVYEASDRAGGKLQTEDFAGVPVETGADSFLPRDDLPVELCRSVGLGDDLISPAAFGAYIWHDGVLRKLPPGFSYGFPAKPWTAYRAGLLSLRGTLRATGDLFHFRRWRGRDVSIGSFVTRRFGREVLDYLVDPMLAGTRAGRAEEISLSSGAPEIATIAGRNGSVIRGLRSFGKEIGAGSQSFVSIRGGLGRLVDALVDRLPDVRTKTHVDALPDTDGIVLTTPAAETARLLATRLPVVTELLRDIRYESSLTVTLLYPPNTFNFPADGSGVLVPSKAGLAVTAVTWYSHKWPHARPGDGSQIIRCFIGGRGSSLPRSDEAIARATADLETIMGVHEQPTDARVTSWERGLPVFAVSHTKRIVGLDHELMREIAVAGAYLTGSGIPECIHQAKRAAEQVGGWLRGVAR